MRVLITGGAGYIGSHVVKQLLETTSYEVYVLDNLSTGSANTIDNLKKIRNFKFINLDLNNFLKVNEILKEFQFNTIMHFAASIVVPESVKDPLKYYLNNTVNTTYLINAAIKNNVQKFIFSSTAAVYGDPKNIPADGISEDADTKPINPYGTSKLMSEQVLNDAANSSSLKYIVFRYFNVAGADVNYTKNVLEPRFGQTSKLSTHLLKIASESALGKRDKLLIFGNNFNTLDGTGVRDYIHVDDLAKAHISAIDYLEKHDSDIFNIGYSRGYSVKEVIDVMKCVSGVDFQVEVANRRDGDTAILIANNQKIKSKMNWAPKYNDLNLICKSALLWEKYLKMNKG